MIQPAQRRKPIAAELARRADAQARAATALATALDGCAGCHTHDAAFALIDHTAAYLAGEGLVLRLTTHLRALDGRLAPAIKSTERCQLERDVFGGRG